MDKLKEDKQISRAVTSFFVLGGHRECRRHPLVGGSDAILPEKIFKFVGSEMLFSALIMRYVSEKSTSNMKMAKNCKLL